MINVNGNANVLVIYHICHNVCVHLRTWLQVTVCSVYLSLDLTWFCGKHSHFHIYARMNNIQSGCANFKKFIRIQYEFATPKIVKIWIYIQENIIYLGELLQFRYHKMFTSFDFSFFVVVVYNHFFSFNGTIVESFRF